MLERMDWRSDSWMAGVPAPEPAPPGAGAGTGTVAGVLEGGNRKYYNHRSYCQSICLLSHLLLVVLGLLSAGCLDLVLPVPTNNTNVRLVYCFS